MLSTTFSAIPHRIAFGALVTNVNARRYAFATSSHNVAAALHLLAPWIGRNDILLREKRFERYTGTTTRQRLPHDDASASRGPHLALRLFHTRSTYLRSVFIFFVTVCAGSFNRIAARTPYAPVRYTPSRALLTTGIPFHTPRDFLQPFTRHLRALRMWLPFLPALPRMFRCVTCVPLQRCSCRCDTVSPNARYSTLLL